MDADYFCPSRPPGLEPLYTFIWCYIKQKFYAGPVTTEDDMKAYNDLPSQQLAIATNESVLKEVN